MPNQDNPENQTFTLSIVDTGRVIDIWQSYRFNSNFLTPTDAFSFTLGDESVSGDLLKELVPGARVQLEIFSHIQASGYIDSISVETSRSGTSITVDGRDMLSYAVDAAMDPLMKFAPKQTLEQVIKQALAPYGFTALVDENEKNKNIITGQERGVKTTKKGKSLKSFVEHQLKPYPSEGVFAFVSRIAQRFGLWVWLSANGKDIVVGTPNFDQDPRYTLIRSIGLTSGERNNVISGSIKRDNTDQPSCIIATGVGTGGENPRGKLIAIAINELTALDEDGNMSSDVKTAIANYPNAKVLKLQSFQPVSRYLQHKARPIYLHDDESKTIEQLQFFARREMAIRQRKALTAKYTVEGHVNNGQPWAVDTMVSVEDDIGDIHQDMYVIGRTFVKDRSGGTRTEVELILPNTLEFDASETE